MLNFLAAAVAAAVLAQNDAPPAPATPTAAEAAPAAKPAKPAKPKLVCVTNQPTGSRLGGERVCKTAEEWEKIHRDSRDTIDDNQRRGLQISMPPNTTGG